MGADRDLHVQKERLVCRRDVGSNYSGRCELGFWFGVEKPLAKKLSGKLLGAPPTPSRQGMRPTYRECRIWRVVQ